MYFSISCTHLLTASKYVPPHLRKSAAQGEQKDARLLRQLKGQINKYYLYFIDPLNTEVCYRLSEQNISTILTELEEVYRQNSRNGKFALQNSSSSDTFQM